MKMLGVLAFGQEIIDSSMQTTIANDCQAPCGQIPGFQPERGIDGYGRNSSYSWLGLGFIERHRQALIYKPKSYTESCNH